MLVSSLTSLDIVLMHALTCLLSRCGTGGTGCAVVTSIGGEVRHGWCIIVGGCCLCGLHFHAVSVSCVRVLCDGAAAQCALQI